MTGAKLLRPGIALTALLAVSGACTEKKEKPRLYPFRGTVVRLDPNTNVAVIHNEKVDGWMEEMTMEYPIEDRNEYMALHKGEKISAMANVTSDGYWLSNVKERQGD